MLELDRGRAYVHESGYASYLAAAAERADRAAEAEASRRNLAGRELAWLRRGAPRRVPASPKPGSMPPGGLRAGPEAAARTSAAWT